MTEAFRATAAAVAVNVQATPIQRPLVRALAQAMPGAMLLSAGLLLSPAALAATYQVSNLNDSGSGSLRDAIGQANGNLGADTITFASSVSGTINLTSGTLLITDDLAVQGPGASVLTVNGSGIVAAPDTNQSARFKGRHKGEDGGDNNTQGGGGGGNGPRTSVFTVNAYGGGQPQGTNATNQTLASSTVSISGLTISGGSSKYGGGIYAYDTDLTVSQCVVSGNTATRLGGGIAISGDSASLLVSDSSITGNAASNPYYGPGPNAVTGGNTGYGGGVGTFRSAITIQRSTISNNSATGSGGGVSAHTDNPYGPLVITDSVISGNNAGYAGGGVYVRHQTFSVSNSTISGNTAGYTGGGVQTHISGPLTITNGTTGGGGGYSAAISNSTISNNQAGYYGGGIRMDDSATLTLSNAVVGGNSASSDPDINTSSAAAVAADHSLIEATGSANIVDNGGNITGQAPMLGALADNGGPTLTQLPLAGSPLIDAGDPGFAGPANDQRGAGFPRIVNGIVDMGATEFAAGAPPAPPPASVSVPGLGNAGKLGLGMLLGLAGLAVARRRRSLMPAPRD